MLADKMSTDFRAQYNAEVAARRGSGGGGGNHNLTVEDVTKLRLGNVQRGALDERLDPEAQRSRLNAGLNEALGIDGEGGGAGGGGGGGGTVQGVDPFARLAENIESGFEVEIDRNRQVDETQRNTRHLMAVLSGAERGV